MNKKIIIPIFIVIFILVIGYYKYINRFYSYIILDINPSIKINLNKDNKVLGVIPLNEDAKKIIKDNLINKSLEEALNVISDNLIENNYINDDNTIDILLYSNNIESKKLEEIVRDSYENKNVMVILTVVDNITKEDIDYAKKNNISISKSAYINNIVKEKDIEKEILNNKPVRELQEVKNRGKYCNDGYILEGDFCLKEIDRVNAKNGMVCSEGYYEYKGKCYEETPSIETDKLVCRDEFTLEKDKCIKTTSVNAVITGYTCSKGEVRTKLDAGLSVKGAGDANDAVCVDPASKTHPVSPCELPASNPTERMFYGGKCYWHQAPVIESGCPGKIQVNGFCWDDASNVYLCPSNSAQKNKDEYCYTVLKNVKPTVSGYKCEDNYKLVDNKCVKEEIEDAEHEKVCEEGYTKVDHDRCINMNKSKNKEDGYYCEDEHAKLKNNMCIIYEIVDANVT